MLLQLPALRGGRPHSDERTLSELHMPQADAHVLSEGLSLHKGCGSGLHCGEEA